MWPSDSERIVGDLRKIHVHSATRRSVLPSRKLSHYRFAEGYLFVPGFLR